MVARIKKQQVYIILLLCVLVTAGCARSTISSSNSQCVFPDSFRAPAPNFICDPTYPGYAVTQLVQSSQIELPVRDRIALATHQQNKVWAEQWSSDWYEGAMVEVAQLWLLDYLEEHVRVLRSRTSPKGVLWLLIGIPHSLHELKQQFEQTLLLP